MGMSSKIWEDEALVEFVYSNGRWILLEGPLASTTHFGRAKYTHDMDSTFYPPTASTVTQFVNSRLSLNETTATSINTGKSLNTYTAKVSFGAEAGHIYLIVMKWHYADVNVSVNGMQIYDASSHSGAPIAVTVPVLFQISGVTLFGAEDIEACIFDMRF